MKSIFKLLVWISTGLSASAFAAQNLVMYYDFTGDGVSDAFVKDDSMPTYVRRHVGTGTHMHWERDELLVNATHYIPGKFTTSSHGVMARLSNGELWFYKWTGSAFVSQGRVGTGWNFTHYLPGDFNGDGVTDLFVRDSSGNLRLYLWNGTAFSAQGIKGTGWNFTDYFTVDFNHDGKTDILVRNSAGELKLYPWTGTAFAASYQVGHGFNFDKYIGGHFDSDQYWDLVAEKNGTLFRYEAKLGTLYSVPIAFDAKIPGFSSSMTPIYEGSGGGISSADRAKFDTFVTTVGLDIEPNNDNKYIGFQTSYLLMALMDAYKITRDVTYLEYAVTAIDDVLSKRDALRGVVDFFRNRNGKGWSAVFTYNNEWSARNTETLLDGSIAYPIAMFARIVLEDKALHQAFRAKAVTYRAALREVVDFHAPEWVQRPDGAGYYKSVTKHASSGGYCDTWGAPQDCQYVGKMVPLNYQLAFAAALLELSRAGDGSIAYQGYLAKAKALGALFKYDLTPVPQGTYSHRNYDATDLNVCQNDFILEKSGQVIQKPVNNLIIRSSYRWHYAFPELKSNEWYAWRFNRSEELRDIELEDFQHAAIDLEYAGLLHRYGLIFTTAEKQGIFNSVHNLLDAKLDGNLFYGSCQGYPYFRTKDKLEGKLLLFCGRMLDLSEFDSSGAFRASCENYLRSKWQGDEKDSNSFVWYLGFIKAIKWK